MRGQRFSLKENASTHILIMEEAMRPTTAESTLRALIATVPDQRLRELVVELILTALRCLADRSLPSQLCPLATADAATGCRRGVRPRMPSVASVV